MIHAAVRHRARIKSQHGSRRHIPRVSDLTSSQEGVEDGHEAGEEVPALDNLGRDGGSRQHLQRYIDDGVIWLAISDEVELSERGIEAGEPQTKDPLEFGDGDNRRDVGP